mgnify:CR=1 FL=1
MMIDVPVLRSIPILSDIFNNHTAITYLTFLVVIVLTVVMYKTSLAFMSAGLAKASTLRNPSASRQPHQVPVPDDLRRDLRTGRTEPFG